MRKLLSVVRMAMWLSACGGASEVPGSAVQGNSACVPQVESNLLEDSSSAGDVTVSTVDGDVVVTVATSGTMAIGQVDAFAGPGPIPADDAGVADPSLFPYHAVVEPPSRTAELRIPIASLGLSCGDSITLVVHSGAGFMDSSTGQLLGVVDAWAGGPSGFAYTPCCTPEPDGTACTRSHGDWKNHPAGWPVSELELGSATYSSEVLLQILSAPSKGDASVILGHQLVAAKLNVAAGGTPPDEVASAITSADVWLDASGVQTIPGNIPAGSPAGREATALSDALGSFNEGRAGVPACD
jgi:hypothetical protein